MADTPKEGWTLEELQALRDEILRLAAKFGASNVRVFGSVARGEATPESDVDLLVSFPPDRSMFELVGMWLDLKDLLGCEVSLVPDGIDDRDFLQQILQDAVPL